MKLELLYEATYHRKMDTLKRIIQYANDSEDHIVKFPDSYDHQVKMVKSLWYYDEKYINDNYEDEDEMEPYVGVEFIGDEDIEPVDPETFMADVQVYEINRII